MSREQTIEEMIVAMEKRGWRLSCLSYIGNAHAYSCILERKKTGEDGRGVFAFNHKELHTFPRDAVAHAWENAQLPIGNPRVVAEMHRPKPTETDVEAWIEANLGYKIRLEDAITGNRKCRDGVEDEADDFL